MGAGVGFCASDSFGGGVDEVEFVFSSVCAGCFGSAAYSVPDGFAGVSVYSACSRVSGMLSVGFSDSAGADGLSGISLFGSAADVTSAEVPTEDGLSVIVSGGSCLPHPARLMSVRPARRSAYRFSFIIRITSDYKDTEKSLKVQRESAVF